MAVYHVEKCLGGYFTPNVQNDVHVRKNEWHRPPKKVRKRPGRPVYFWDRPFGLC